MAFTLTLVVFLVCAERARTSSMALCRTVAIAMHYFALAMFFWTSIQAYNMYLSFVKVMPRYYSNFMFKSSVVGWGLYFSIFILVVSYGRREEGIYLYLAPLIVTVCAPVAVEKYGDEQFCRVQGSPFYYGFLTPVVLIIALNSVAFVLIINSLMNAGSKIAANKSATGLQHVRRSTAILIVLGLTWIFGVFALSDANLIFQYLFAILNSFQGFLVFVFYCLLSSDTRAKYAKLCQNQRGSENSRKRYTPHTTSKG
ncbi:adhesion G-protein coupled receptor G2-like [Xenia sp. Carnegie-2017]|uniref:adhesion G-protein coupled receptor G2-like n=1 Tax=Xenia sp. Carnegie-2017 TaxID=2897299 RepID=UPI001F034B1C|nr:adhesion G-protein coupled receptor G2-like [Xenia sp. Carnegie-2017]